MSSMGFRKYVEAMGRTPLDKKPEALRKLCEDSSSDGLLPHQRTGPAKRRIATQVSEFKTPEKRSDDNVRLETCRQDDPAPSTNGDTNAEKKPDKSHLSPQANQKGRHHNDLRLSDDQRSSSKPQLIHSDPLNSQNRVSLQENQLKSPSLRADSTKKIPGIVSGLQTSRWAPLDSNITPMNKTDESTAAALRPMNDQRQSTVKKQAATPLIRNTNVDAHHLSVHDCTSAQRETTTLIDLKTENQVRGSELDGVRKRSTPPHLRTTRKRPEASTKETTTSAQPKEAEVNKQDCEGPVPDPRGNWPTEARVPKTAHGTNEERIRNKNSQSREWSSNEISNSTEPTAAPPHLTNYIEHWVQESHEANADLPYHNMDEHEGGDADVNEGSLARPVNDPDIESEEEILGSDAEQTSEAFVQMYAAMSSGKITRNMGRRKLEQLRRNTMERTAKAAKKKRVVAEEEPEPPNPYELRFPCHLRAAMESDIDAITAIYNQEVRNGYKVIDTKTIRPEDMRGVYNQCRAQNRPFVVAVEGRYGEVNTFEARILGFSLITSVDRGIAGSDDTLSHPRGKLWVIVKPEHRRKKVGTALIDVIVTNCTGWYNAKGGYQFVDFPDNWMSAEFGRCPRKWWYLETSVTIASGASENSVKKGEEYQWIREFLEAKFDLILRHHDHKYYYAPRQMIWLDKLTFYRTCRLIE